LATDGEVANLGSDFSDNAGDLVSEDLRMRRQRPRTPKCVAIVVRMSSDDVQIGAAQSDGLDAHHHFGW